MIPVTPVPPGLADQALLDVPGGFLWCYLDLVDATGDGLVLVVSFGLPFLPGGSSARALLPVDEALAPRAPC